MAQSAHAYVRGSTARFYEWLESGQADVPDGPPVWICGDCHLGNLGPLANRKGRVAVQIRDLDQTVIGNPAHDLIRLGLSLASAARGSDLPGVVTARILEHLTAGYESALAGDFDAAAEEDLRPQQRRRPPSSVGALLDRSVKRRWRHLAAERLESIEPVLRLGKKFWALTGEERTALNALFEGAELHAMIAGLQAREAGEPVKIVDAAYWMKGCSSLGRLRYAVMLRVGRGKRAAPCLVDIKEAVKAAAPRSAAAAMPADNAARVVAGAKALSPNLGQRMIAGRMLGRPGGAARTDATGPEAGGRAADPGPGHRAGGISGERAGQGAWPADGPGDPRGLAGRTGPGAHARLDAPSWLWSSVVDLLGIHERAYLEHCRAYALTLARAAA